MPETLASDGTPSADDCLFCRMVSGLIDVPKLYEDDLVFAIRDINPRAPVHLLIIPKQHVPDARHVAASLGLALARMFEVAAKLARSEDVHDRGYRLAFNAGDDAGMTISHLHMHLVGGRPLGPEG